MALKTIFNTENRWQRATKLAAICCLNDTVLKLKTCPQNMGFKPEIPLRA